MKAENSFRSEMDQRAAEAKDMRIWEARGAKPGEPVGVLTGRPFTIIINIK